MHTRTVNYVDVTHSNGCKKIKIKWWRVEQSRAERYTDICVLCTHSVRNNNISRPSLASVMMYQTQLPDAIWEQERIHTHILPCYTHVITSKWKCVQHVQSKPKCIHGHSGLCKACNSPFLIIPIHFFLLLLPWRSFNQIDWQPYALSQNRVVLNAREYVGKLNRQNSARSLLKQAPRTCIHLHTHTRTSKSTIK